MPLQLSSFVKRHYNSLYVYAYLNTYIIQYTLVFPSYICVHGSPHLNKALQYAKMQPRPIREEENMYIVGLSIKVEHFS
jgi:hypothetical protein